MRNLPKAAADQRERRLKNCCGMFQRFFMCVECIFLRFYLVKRKKRITFALSLLAKCTSTPCRQKEIVMDIVYAPAHEELLKLLR